MSHLPSYFSRFEFWLAKTCLISLLSISSLGSLSHAAFNGFQVEPHGIPLDEILSGGPPRDGIPALMNPQFLPANEVEFVSPEDRVLGIQGAHEIKAYPIGILNWHEIVNDTLDGTPIVITYCPLCGTGIGFLRKVGTDIISFGVSGLLYQSDVLMYDHQTESLWSQIAMQAITGESLGQQLEPIFLEHTTWKAWRQHHPQTLVLSRKTGYTRDYKGDPYQSYALTDRLLFPPARQHDRLPPKEWVLGVEIKGKFKAYPFSALEKLEPAFSDSLHQKDYVVCWDREAKSAKVIDQRGKPMTTLMAYWFAWFAFHPDTEVFQIDSKQHRLEQKVLHAACSQQ